MASIREAIYMSLSQTGKKMTAKEIYEYIKAHKLASFSGETPLATVQALAGDFIRNNDTRVMREKIKGGKYLYYATKCDPQPSLPQATPILETVPGFQEFILPILRKFSDGNSYSVTDIRRYCISYFNLSDEALKASVKSGRKTQVSDRVDWSITYLYQAKLIVREKRGVYSITPRGMDLLKSSPTKIDIKLLRQYPEFTDFSFGKKEDDTTSLQNEETTQTTPFEIFDRAYEEIASSLKQQLLDVVMQQTPAFFESLVVKLLVAMGYGGSFEDAARVTQISHDDGIDGVIKEDKLGFASIYVQAKRYTTGNVQKPDMQKFIGALAEQSASKGVFITTSSFSQGAQETARKAKGVKIVLIDGELLTKYMIEYNIGVARDQVYEIKKIDSDFFE